MKNKPFDLKNCRDFLVSERIGLVNRCKYYGLNYIAKYGTTVKVFIAVCKSGYKYTNAINDRKNQIIFSGFTNTLNNSLNSSSNGMSYFQVKKWFHYVQTSLNFQFVIKLRRIP
jgi:hypothetical protein